MKPIIKRCTIIIAQLSIFIFCSFLYGQDTLYISIEKDAYIDYYNQATNFGDEEYIIGKSSESPDEIIRSLLYFDISSIPDSGYIHSADLFLYGNGHDNGTGSNSFVLQRITEHWDEDAVTWESKPTTTSVDQIVENSSQSQNENYEIDIKFHVNDMREEGENHGFMLKLDSESPTAIIRFNSSDHSSEYRPVLRIIYEIPTPIQVAFTTVHVDPVNTGIGAIDLDVSGGIEPYAYSWTDGSSNWTTQDISSLDAGDYSLTITDDNGTMYQTEVGIGYSLSFSSSDFFQVIKYDVSDPCINVDYYKKYDASNQWTGGVVSDNFIPEQSDGWVEYHVESQGYNRMFGLTEAGEGGGDWTNIDYGFFMNNENDLIRIEGGSQYSFSDDTYKNGDVLRLERVGTSIVYSKNGVVLYTNTDAGNQINLAIDLNIYHANSEMSPLTSSVAIPFSISSEVTQCTNSSIPNGAIDITLDYNALGTGISYSWVKNESESAWSTQDINGICAGTYSLTVSHSSTSYTVNRKFILAFDDDYNWILTKIYDEDENIIGESKVYLNRDGKQLQFQTKDIENNNVLASQPLYDHFGRQIGQSLTAPVYETEFTYRPQFITNLQDEPYENENFNIANYTGSSVFINPGEVDNPLPVKNTEKGSLGWYYSNNNSDEPFVATTSFPYGRFEFDENNPGGTIRNAAPHDYLRMGSGHNTSSHTMLAAGELRRVYSYGGWAGDFLNSSSLTGCNDLVMRNNLIDYKAFKTISYDEDGKEYVVFVSSDGWVLASAYSGPGDDGINDDTYEVTSILYNEKGSYVDIHIPKGCEGTLTLDNNDVSPKFNYQILDLRTNMYLKNTSGGFNFNTNYPLVQGGNPVPAGVYRITCSEVDGTWIQLGGQSDLTYNNGLAIKYDINYYDYTLHYYDKAGRLIATVPPLGVDLYESHPLIVQRSVNADFVLEGSGEPREWGLTSQGNSELSVSQTDANSTYTHVINQFNIFLDTDADDIKNNAIFPSTEISSNSNAPNGSQSLFAEQLAHQYEVGTSFDATGCDCLDEMADCIYAHNYSEARMAVKNFCKNGFPNLESKGEGRYCLTCDDQPQVFEKQLIFSLEVLVLVEEGESEYSLTNSSIIATKYSDGWDFYGGDLLSKSNIPGSFLYSASTYNEETASDLIVRVNDVMVLIPELVENEWDGNSINISTDFEYIDDIRLHVLATEYKINDNPTHSMYTTYDYNSVGELLSVKEPDMGKTEYLYSKEGLLRFSQSSEQRQYFKFSYFRYDEAMRLIEQGETQSDYYSYHFENYYNTSYTYNPSCTTCASVRDVLPSGLEIVDDIDWDNNDFKRQDQTLTYYDRHVDVDSETDDYLTDNGYCQDFVRGRVSYSRFHGDMVDTYSEYDSKTFYSYNPDGSLSWSIQAIPKLLSTPFTSSNSYEYDKTGNMIQAMYEDNQSNSFGHKYSYDNNQRLIKAEIKEGSNAWLEVAEYKYYLHGPLKREEIENDLQGIDYIYTTTGWLKAINSPNLGYNGCYKFKDPGSDGFGSSAFSPDVFGITLDYFNYDYERKKTNVNFGDWEYLDNQQSYFSGLIRGLRWNQIEQEASELVTGADHIMYQFTYNTKNWLQEALWGMYVEGCQNERNPGVECQLMWDPVIENKKFERNSNYNYIVGDISYDANGNMKTLTRKAHNSGGSNSNMDDFTYHYTSCSNQLNRITDGVSSGNWAVDLDNQTTSLNYEYDSAGQMIVDNENNLQLKYDSYGLVTLVSDLSGPNIVGFSYDDHGSRLSKVVYDSEGAIDHTLWYINDASGKNILVYKKSSSSLDLVEAPIYAMNTIGKVDLDGVSMGSGTNYYSISDHLGNVRAVIKRNVSDDAEVESWSDYYPFGMVMPGRNLVNSPRYKQGYQGQFTEHDEETGWDAFELRMLDTRMGRWTAVDPYNQYHSPYVSMGNNPISSVDPDGGWSWLGAGIGAAVGAGVGAAVHYGTGGSNKDAWKAVVGGAVAGGVAGGLLGQGIYNKLISGKWGAKYASHGRADRVGRYRNQWFEDAITHDDVTQISFINEINGVSNLIKGVKNLRGRINQDFTFYNTSRITDDGSTRQIYSQRNDQPGYNRNSNSGAMGAGYTHPSGISSLIPFGGTWTYPNFIGVLTNFSSSNPGQSVTYDIKVRHFVKHRDIGRRPLWQKIKGKLQGF